MLDQYQTTFQALQTKNIGLAQETLGKILATSPKDQTALELANLLAQTPAQFPYTVVMVPPLVVFYKETEMEQQRLAYLLEHAKAACAHLQKFPGLRLPSLILALIDANIQQAHADYKERPHVPKIRIHPLSSPGTVVHEIAHLAFIHPNRFLAEGVAMYMQSSLCPFAEDYSFQKIFHGLGRSLLPLSSLILEHEERLHYFADGFGNQSERILAYHEAGSFVHFLIHRLGWEKFCRLADCWQIVVEPALMSQAMSEITGSTLHVWETEWLQYLEREVLGPAPQASGTHPLVVLWQQSSITHSVWPIPGAFVAEYWEGVVSELEITLPLQPLLSLHRLFSQRVEKSSAGPETIYLRYYQARIGLALLNAWELEIGWLYQDMAQMTKAVPGFAAIRKIGIDLVDGTTALVEDTIASAKTFHALADLHRLLGELYGRGIKYKGKLTAITSGPLATKELEAAYRGDAKNVRTLTALGRQKLFTPKLFGGGIVPAQQYFLASLEQNPLFNEGYIGLALCSYVEKKQDQFVQYLQKALELHHADRCAQKLWLQFQKGEELVR